MLEFQVDQAHVTLNGQHKGEVVFAPTSGIPVAVLTFTTPQGWKQLTQLQKHPHLLGNNFVITDKDCDLCGMPEVCLLNPVAGTVYARTLHRQDDSVRI